MKNTAQSLIEQYIKEIISEDAGAFRVIDPELHRMLGKVGAVTSMINAADGYPNREIEKAINEIAAELTEARDWMRDHKHPMGAVAAALVSTLEGLSKLSKFTSRPLFFQKGEYQEKILTVTRKLEVLKSQLKQGISKPTKTFG